MCGCVCVLNRNEIQFIYVLGKVPLVILVVTSYKYMCVPDPLFSSLVRPGSCCVEPVDFQFIFVIRAVAVEVNTSVLVVERTFDRL